MSENDIGSECSGFAIVTVKKLITSYEHTLLIAFVCEGMLLENNSCHGKRLLGLEHFPGGRDVA